MYPKSSTAFGKFFLTEVFWLVKGDEIIENYYFATSNEVIDLGNKHNGWKTIRQKANQELTV